MSFGIYSLMFVVGACLLAVWANTRLTRFAPRDMRTTFIHLGASLVACQVVAPLAVTFATHNGDAQLRLISVIGVALPALTYAVLSMVWVIAQLQATMHRGSMR
jgi:hypothetical protein